VPARSRGSPQRPAGVRARIRSLRPGTSLRADCLAGAWAASILLQNRPESQFRMSPGDLDKAIMALIVFRGSGDAARQGQGSTRVDAYRDGVMNGAKACLSR